MADTTWRKLTIPLDGLSVDDLLKEWRWLVPATMTPLWLSAFGDWAFVGQDKRVFHLDILEGSFGPIALFESAMTELLESEEMRNRCLSADWFEICNKRGLYLGPGQCYGWKVAPILGGEFNFSNIQVFDVLVYETIMGQLHRQLKELPEGYVISELRLRP